MRKYTVGINVTHVDELADMAPKVKSFLDVLGDGDLDLQLMVNPHGNEFVETNVIGFVPDNAEYEDEEYYGEEAEDDE